MSPHRGSFLRIEHNVFQPMTLSSLSSNVLEDLCHDLFFAICFVFVAEWYQHSVNQSAIRYPARWKLPSASKHPLFHEVLFGPWWQKQYQPIDHAI
jgi:hypothetical protein